MFLKLIKVLIMEVKHQCTLRGAGLYQSSDSILHIRLVVLLKRTPKRCQLMRTYMQPLSFHHRNKQ